MARTKLIIVGSFLVVFAAGVALGMFFHQVKRGHEERSWLSSELNLTAEQQKSMRKIWSEAMGDRQGGESRAALAQQRDQAVLALLTEAQRTQYDAIQQDYAQKAESLTQQRRRAFEDAVEQTKKILTPEQAVKYDELLKRQRERGPRHHHTAASSEPTTNESTARVGQ